MLGDLVLKEGHLIQSRSLYPTESVHDAAVRDGMVARADYAAEDAVARGGFLLLVLFVRAGDRLDDSALLGR